MKYGDLSNDLMEEVVLVDIRDLIKRKSKIRGLFSLKSPFSSEYDVDPRVEDFLYKVWKHFRIIAFYFPKDISQEDIHIAWITKHLPFDSYLSVSSYEELRDKKQKLNCYYLFSEHDDIITSIDEVHGYSVF